MEGDGRGGSPEGLPRFECPPDLCASHFAPGPPFSLEILEDPSKELLLIRAPANFNPESLNGHVLPLLGSQTLKVPQSNGAQKVYSTQVTPGVLGSCARLVVPSGQQDCLTCAPPFNRSLNIWERFGDPSANSVLPPVADRLGPQIPEGLKQRFVPFGGQLKRPAFEEAAKKSPCKKKKKRQLQVAAYMGDPEEQVAVADRGPETTLEESMPAAEGPQEGKKKHHHLKKQATAAEKKGETFCEQDSQSSGSLLASSQENLISAEVPSHKSKKKKKKLKEEVMESGELLVESGSLIKQSEPEPGLQLEFEPPVGETRSTGAEEVVQNKRKKKKKKFEEGANTQEALTLMDPAPLHEEAMREPWETNELESPTEGSLGLAVEEPEVALSGHKPKKKKKKEKVEKEEDEQIPTEQARGTVVLEPSSITEELKDWDEPAASFGDSMQETSMDAPSHKHKKKKKKEHKREVD